MREGNGRGKGKRKERKWEKEQYEEKRKRKERKEKEHEEKERDLGEGKDFRKGREGKGREDSIKERERKIKEGCINARVKGHLESTHLKSLPLFTFSKKSLGQVSPSIHFFSKIIGSRFITPKIKLGEDSIN